MGRTMSEDVEERIARTIQDAAPIAVKVLFEGATDQTQSRTRRLKYMKALVNRPDLTRAYLTTVQLQEFSASIKVMADDPSTSVAQQNQALKLLNLGHKYGLWILRR